MPAKKTVKPKQKYQILVNRQMTYRFEVEAESAEKACQKLYRKLQPDDTLQIEADVKPLFFRWSEPTEPREEWAVMCVAPTQEGKRPLLQAWDGKRFLALGEGKIGDDIVQTMRSMVDQRARTEKPKQNTRSALI